MLDNKIISEAQICMMEWRWCGRQSIVEWSSVVRHWTLFLGVFNVHWPIMQMLCVRARLGYSYDDIFAHPINQSNSCVHKDREKEACTNTLDFVTESISIWWYPLKYRNQKTFRRTKHCCITIILLYNLYSSLAGNKDSNNTNNNGILKCKLGMSCRKHFYFCLYNGLYYNY